jgi:putative endopeptidase
MRRQSLAFIFVALPGATILVTAQSASESAPLSPSGIELASLDRVADPCSDFYQFSCGGWIAANPLPADRPSYGRFQEVQDRNLYVLRRILDTPTIDANRRKASDYYAACLDEAGINARGLTPLRVELARIEALTSIQALPALLAHLHEIGASAFFRFDSRTDLKDATQQIASVDQAGITLPDRDDYLKTDARSTGLREKYLSHLHNMFGLTAGAPPGDPSAVVAIETALAVASLDRVSRRNPASLDHPMRQEDLQMLSPSFDWEQYRVAARAPILQKINVAVPDFVKAFDRVLTTTPLADLKSYLRWQLLHASAFVLPAAFDREDFDFFRRAIAGQEMPAPRWRRCIVDTDERLGEAVGQAFVQETFGPQAKADMLSMVRDIKAAMKRDIDDASWMTAETKKAATVKLNAVVDRIGYPDTWRDYSALTIARNDALGNLYRATAFERQRELAKIGQPVDRNEWSMTPPTVNAYYSPARNNINFPAGILQPPFYSAGRDAAVNYGAAGGVIGHELTHGFDDQGRRYDPLGSLLDWWTAADGAAFERRASCIADEYSQFLVAGDTHINGQLTLGENTADNGGLRLALMAYLNGPGSVAQPVLDGFTPEQRLFVGWGQQWCENATPQRERLKAQTNPHASNKYRVNGVVANMPEFQKAFSCKAGAPMVRPTMCRVW